MTISWFGLSSFKITGKDITIITDPFGKSTGLTAVRGAADVVIKAAAPLDFRPKSIAAQKIKKKKAELSLDLEPTADILKDLGAHKNGRVLVGFAAETENHLKHGLEKLRAKNLDLIVVNSVGGPDSAFDSDINHATIIDMAGNTEEIPTVSKHAMADRILDRVAQLLK